MAATSMTVEIESSVEAKRLWNALIKNEHTFLPEQAPEIFAGVTIVEGDGGVGTIKQINFTSVNEDFSYVKERVDEFDEANFVYAFSHVEGGLLGKRLAFAKFKLEFRAKAEGGCIHTWTCEYETLPGTPHDMAKAQEAKNNITTLFRKMEAYLISNPSLYC